MHNICTNQNLLILRIKYEKLFTFIAVIDMDYQGKIKSENIIILSDETIEELLEPISNQVLVDYITRLKGSGKKINFKPEQTKKEFIYQHLGNKLNITQLRQLKAIREHSSISKFNWNIYFWDKNISRYYPNKMKKKIDIVFLAMEPIINIDIIIVDEPTQTVFLLVELKKKEKTRDNIFVNSETPTSEYYRIYFSLTKKTLLLQDKDKTTTKQFLEAFEKIFNVKTQEVKINALFIREFVKNNPQNLTKLIVKLPQEIVGFEGLSELILLGNDVIKGSKGLIDRHETSPINVGPWIGISTAELDFNVGKSIKTTSIIKVLEIIDMLKSNI